MTLRWFVYYCAAWAACAAYLGWLLGRLVTVQHHVFQAAIKGLFLGLVLAVVLVLVDLAFNGAKGLSAVWRVLVGGLVGGLGGFVGGMVGQLLYSSSQLSLFLVLGWLLTGLLIGSAPGMFEWLDRLARDEEAGGAQRKLRNGILGGALGGLLGGGLFLAQVAIWGLALGDRADHFWSPSATGFVVLGACIGLMMGLAQVILKEAWIKVESGFRAGRELILTQPETTVGRAEDCDIGLFGDPKIEKLHARIVHRGGRYYVEDADSDDGTFVNGEAVIGPRALRDGDQIEIGKACLRFGERQKREQ